MKLPREIITNLNLQYTMNNKKLFFGFLAILLVIPLISASIISTIGMQGLSFVNPQAAQIVQGILCVTNPAGAIACAESYVEGKIMGEVTGKAFQEIAKLSPEAAESILKYNEIKGYLDQGGSILEELKLNEKGEIEEGIIDLKGDEQDISSFFQNSTEGSIQVMNSTYDFKNKLLTIKEGGFLKLKVNKNGKEEELIYENIHDGGFFKFNDEGEIEEAEITSNNYANYSFGNNPLLKVGPATPIKYEKGIIKIGSDKRFEDNYFKPIEYMGKNIYSRNGFIILDGNKISSSNFMYEINDIEIEGAGKSPTKIISQGILFEPENEDSFARIRYKKNEFVITEKEGSLLIANKEADLSGYKGSWVSQTDRMLELKSSETGTINLREFYSNHEILKTKLLDNVHAKISGGDYLSFENRGEEGLVPEVFHIKSPKGTTEITNGQTTIKIGDEISVDVKPLDYNKVFRENKFQSLGMEINPSLEFKNKIKMNSFGQFIMTSRTNEEVVSYNNYGLPVSNLLEDNDVEIIKKRYPEIIKEIGVSEGANINPNSYYIIDNFFKKNPGATKNIKEIKIEPYSNTGSSFWQEDGTFDDGYLVLSSPQLDPTSAVYVDFASYRDFPNPVSIIDHEYEHFINAKLKKEEIEYFVDREPNFKGKIENLRLLYETKKKIGEELSDENFKAVNFGDEESKKKAGELGKDYIDINTLISGSERDIQNSMITDGYTPLYLQHNNLAKSSLEKLKNDENYYKKQNALLLEFDFDYLRRFENGNPESMINDLSNAREKLLLAGNKNGAIKIERFIRENTGVPNAYSLYHKGGNFNELSSTFIEKSVEHKTAMVSSSNPNIKEVYTKLTQLAFDSGKMKAEEYKKIMGKGICKNDDCSDKLCVEYKLLCCASHPTSPNC